MVAKLRKFALDYWKNTLLYVLAKLVMSSFGADAKKFRIQTWRSSLSLTINQRRIY